ALDRCAPRWYRRQSSNVTRGDMASAAPVLKLRVDRSMMGDRQLFALGRAGNAAAREALVRQYMPLARTLARRYDRSSEPFDDLLQVSLLGLLKAIERFDPDLGYPFTSF